MKKFVIKKCMKCGAVIEIINDCNCDDCGIKCCNEQMIELTPNSVDAAVEKHVPTYEIIDDEILVRVNHVMEQDHFIEWIAMVSDTEICKVDLKPDMNAECKFKYVSNSKLYAYCNKHGLWTTDILA